MLYFPTSLIFLNIFIHSAISGCKFSFQADELVLLQFKEGPLLEVHEKIRQIPEKDNYTVAMK